MGRSFIMVTGVASALMFAGVWKATAPASGDAASDMTPMPAAAVAPQTITPSPTRRSTAHPRSNVAPPRGSEEPYNVVRSAYGAETRPIGPGNARTEGSVFYSGCREARAAGAAPLYRGQPGYRPGMDGDNDGIACEPYRG